MLLTRLTLAILLCWLPALASSDTLILQSQRSEADGSHRFFYDLLAKLLQGEDYQLQELPEYVAQARALQGLREGWVDVFWAGTNIQRERDLLVIRVPLFGGLLGQRIPVVRQADQQNYRQLDRQGWQQLIACQGAHWPDSDILEYNGFKVTRVARFELMYTMLAAGRCDYFPRALSEVYAELRGLNNPKLVALDSVILSYPFPMYFFVTPKRPQLAAKLEQRLQAMAISGELQRFRQQHPVLTDVFPLQRYQSAQVFNLDNPTLPAATPLNQPHLWLELGQSE
ncbi:hypothetical protein GCM10011297_06170 [Bacterioplanes sanyensis]|uniref:substrate-binding periplasmic protein n=1 Tax=Bacterioplanes sanyensis TaxID=1249553 RepID=UPI001678412D|nr:transporter substrate-binding domain-containing protein [Bacterioplanes sanyensis]GGY35910.1 hypothetical protein GCM10011297_06170 [Bacterioplanes sanyensis]